MKRILLGLAFVLTSMTANAQLIYGLGITGGGIIGTNTNSDAVAGNVGEFKTTTVAAGAAVAGAATTVSKNLTSVSLTAGDWLVSGTCNMLGSTLVATVLSCGLGTTTDTQATQAGGSGIGTDPLSVVSFASSTLPNSVREVSVHPTRVSLSATTTIYMVVNNTFSSGSYTMYGTIKAWRVR